MSLPRATSCLSRWHLIEVNLGDAVLTAEEEANLETCPLCSEEMAAQRLQQQAHRCARLPESLRAALTQPADHDLPTPLGSATTLRPRRRTMVWSSFAGVAAAMAACALWLTLSPAALLDTPAAGDLTKGGAGLLATVRRGDKVVLDGQSIETLPPLREGDFLRLRVVLPAPTWFIKVEALDPEGRWQTFFAGRAPAGGWLPQALKVSAASASGLRLTACPEPNSSVSQCETKAFRF